MWGSCVCPAHFRFVGPHANPQIAEEVWSNGCPPNWYWVPFLILLLPIAPLWDLPWFKLLSMFHRAEDQWY